MILLAVALLQPAVAIHDRAGLLTVDNGRIRVSVHRNSGTLDVTWGTEAALHRVSGEARVNGRRLRTTDLHEHAARVDPVSDAFGKGVRITLTHSTLGKEGLSQHIWVYSGKPELLVQIETVGSKRIRTNYLAPVVTAAPVDLRHRGKLNNLFVPWDNDGYNRYRSDAWGRRLGSGSHEVGALYDDSTRRGLVIGSLDHDVWKSGVRFRRQGGVRAFAGLADTSTRDTQPHGAVTGITVASPRMVVGFYRDWRGGMERFGDLNAIVKPPLAWTGSVPYGWNSWAGRKDKLRASDARTATDFIHGSLPHFRSDSTAYINLDSYWDNLKPEALQAFVSHAHALGLRAGIYWAPFACWGKLDAPTELGSATKFSQIVLHDGKGKPLPRLDGAYPIDPTHPVALQRIDHELRLFVDQGFDYVKLDFLSHGALEARHHDPAVPTGTAAYVIGMRRIVQDLSPSRVGRPFFISASIAPLFPHGYAHSRRISCDAFANIGASEYLLNSTNYGWWTGGRLYRFNDPDSACVYQTRGEPSTTEAEARTRFTASIISGGMMMEGDDLTEPAAARRVMRIYSRAELLDLARRAPSFWPVYGDTGKNAGRTYAWLDRGTVYVAAFNFDKLSSKRLLIQARRLGLTGRKWERRDLWTGKSTLITGDVRFRLAPMDCALVRLSRME